MNKNTENRAENGAINTENVWTRVMNSLPKFGERGISRAQKAGIYQGTELYGADKIDFCRDKEKLDNLVADMGNWGEARVFHGQVIGEPGLTAEELVARRSGITEEMADYISEAYGIDKRPKVEISDDLSLVDGGYKEADNLVLVNASVLRTSTSPTEIMRFLAHELMHCYDNTKIAGNGSQLGEMIKYNQDNYRADGVKDHEAYAGQLYERRAYAREEAVMRQFEEYVEGEKSGLQ